LPKAIAKGSIPHGRLGIGAQSHGQILMRYIHQIAPFFVLQDSFIALNEHFHDSKPPQLFKSNH